MSTPKKTIKIFVASPGDVPDARQVAKRVIDRLARQYAHYADVEPVLWEERPLAATETPQASIPDPSSMDIFILLLWSRLGTPIPDQRYRQYPDRPMTGAEYEFWKADSSYKQSQRPFPLVYRNTTTVTVDRSDHAAIERGQEEECRLREFERHWFRNDDGSWKGYYYPFKEIDEFEELLERHLHEWLKNQLADPMRSDDPIAPRLWPGNPFRGLAAFDVDHAPIFCGRTKALVDLRAKLREGIVGGVAFVLVTGASGAGKSSLVRAGLVASLRDDPALVADNGLVRYAILRPTDATRGASEALRLHVARTFQELDPFELDLDPLGEPERLETAIKEALTRAERGKSLPAPLCARLVLVIDQLEELFSPAIAKDEASRFIDVIDRLARSGRVWVVATLRGDFFSHLDRFPKLSKLAETGLFRLASPQPHEIEQIIRKPAQMGSIRFERHPSTQIPLDAQILREATDDPASLPLLEYILDELWRRRTPDGLITYEEYERLGRLSGAITRRAEGVMIDLQKGQAPEVAAEIDAVLEILVTVAGPDAEPTAARVSQSAVANTPERARVVNRLIQERLVMIDSAPGEAEPMVRLAHERLIERWPRLIKIITEGRRFLEIRARSKSDAEIWVKADEADDYLVSSPRRVEEWRDLLKTKRDRLDLATLRFIDRSITAADARRTRESEREQERLRDKLKTWRLTLLASCAVFLLVLGAGLFSFSRYLEEQDKLQEQQQRVKISAENLRWRIDAYLKDIDNASPNAAELLIQRTADLAKREFQGLPDHVDVLQRQAEVWGVIGDKFLKQAKNSKKALSAYQTAQEIWLRLKDRQQELAQRNLAGAHKNIGIALTEIDADGALAEFRKALDIAQQSEKLHQGEVEWRLDVPDLWYLIGSLKRQLGQEDALYAFEQAHKSALSIAEVATKDNIAFCLCHIVTSLREIGRIKEGKKQWREALEAYTEASKITENLYKDDRRWGATALQILVKRGEMKLAAAQSAIDDYKAVRGIMSDDGDEDAWLGLVRKSTQQLRAKGIANPHMDRVEKELIGTKPSGSECSRGRSKR